MSRKTNNLSRLLQKYAGTLKEQILFKTSHITPGGKIVLLGCFICFCALFFPWISPLDSVISCGFSNIPSTSSFSGVLGNIGFFIACALGAISFSIFSIHGKEKIHFLSLIQLSDRLMSLYGSIFILLIAFHSFLLIRGLQFFSVNIMHGKGIALCITGAIIILLGSIMIKKEHGKNTKGTYISEIDGKTRSHSPEDSRDNMKLPF